MTTPGKPRQSGIPTPGRTGIPTPGRPRSVSSTLQQNQPPDADIMTRALADAIKANDPAQHRASQGDSQSLSPRLLQSGRRSVAERFNASRPSDRAKTPAVPKSNDRPPSRHSDVFAKSVHRQVEIGDNVKIDSLGLEGILRYIGEIEGKNGLWAGVELGGQFVGKGKNNGSVNGSQYFSCSDNCGVFVATTKLSPSIFHQANIPRPPSVASSRNGRITPSFSGRNTPSISTSRVPSLSMSSGRTTPSLNGRITPSLSSGRITPGFTPSAKLSYPSKPAIDTKSDSWKIPSRITPGSRAAKYANMTAKQLSSRKGQGGSPVRGVGELPSSIPSSPSPVSRTLSSPSRPLSSPFSTPKAGLGGRVSNTGPSIPSTRNRPSNNTPRGRIPSGVAMPPPPSPVPAVPRPASTDRPGMEELTLTSLELQGKAMQDRIMFLATDVAGVPPHRPESAGSMHSHTTEGELEHLRARFEALESENKRLRSEKEKIEADAQSTSLVQHLREDCDRAAEDIARLSEEKDRLSKAHETTTANLKDLQQLHDASQQRIDELESHLANQHSESHRVTQALNDEMAGLLSIRKKMEEENLHLRATKADLATQVEELGTQVNELRLAGQETIALYEERLSIADSQRYDLECRIAILEKDNKNPEDDLPTSRLSVHISAAEIDNETLRDQVMHLQKKITSMEDLIEDSRIASEKEEVITRERMKKLKEKEDNMKLELTEGRREVERMTKAETHARRRVEEIEEALRESQVALENARAEIESLRAELSDADNLPQGATQPENEQHSHLRSENLRLQNQNNELLTQIVDLMNNSMEHTDELGKKKLLRDAPLTNGDGSKAPSSSSKHELSTREEITGLKHIIQELQKENQILQSEAEHLRQEVQILENNLDNSTLHDNPETEGSGGPYDTEAMQRLLREQKTRLEAEAEHLRRRTVEMEMKHARATHDLNKEIGELEALVESKIYREDELEQEVERLKDKLSKMKKSSKNSSDASDSRHRTGSSSTNSCDTENPGITNETICEICERPGHDIFNCDLLKEDVPTTLRGKRTPEDKFCSDCETWGHTLADCPHSQDVF